MAYNGKNNNNLQLGNDDNRLDSGAGSPETKIPETKIPEPGSSGGGSGTGDSGSGSSSSTKDSSILDAVKGTGYSEYKPNSTNQANTGAGAASALGTDYSWNQKGAQTASKQYEQDLLTQDQNYLQNRSTIENNAVNYQTEADIMKYQNNQTAEKVGWTGGYVLDQNRQSEYLKQSIQAQMYGAMELQKYGYNSALAAARLSYDLNLQEHALKYYQEAQAAALSEAQLTGVYFSAEVKDMMAQLGVAKQKLKENPDDETAKNLETQINTWFSENNISKEGVKTLEAWQAEQATELQWSNELWTRYNATMEKLEADFATDSSKFIKLDENGNEIFDGLNIETGNWDAMSGKDILNYITTEDAEGNTVLNGYASNQFYSYLDSSIVGQTESGFTKWCESKGLIKTDKDGNKTINTPEKGFAAYLLEYIQESDVIDIFTTKFEGADEEKTYELLGNWDFSINLPDGKTLNITYNELQKITEAENKVNKTGTATELKSSGENGEYTWSNTTYETTGKIGFNGSQYYYKTQLKSNAQNICITTGLVTKVDDPNTQVTANIDADDISVSLYKGDKESVTGGYNIEVSDEFERLAFTTDSEDGKEIAAYYESATGKKLGGGEVIVLGGKMFFYNSGDVGKPYKNVGNGWVTIGAQGCGDNGLKSALQKGGQWAY